MSVVLVLVGVAAAVVQSMVRLGEREVVLLRVLVRARLPGALLGGLGVVVVELVVVVVVVVVVVLLLLVVFKPTESDEVIGVSLMTFVVEEFCL